MHSKRILIVDDERSMSTAVAAVLSQDHYQFDVAHDGNSAMRLISKSEYGLAILDYQMPGMNGVELFQKIREVQPSVQAIMLTAYTTIDKVFPAIDSGIARVISKPVNAGVLLPLVEKMIGMAESTN